MRTNLLNGWVSDHITFAVTDLERSLAFHRDLLGFSVVHGWPGGAYLDLDGLWLCLSVDVAASARPSCDYTHTAFSVSADSFEEFNHLLRKNNVEIWKQNRSEGPSIYFLDPDGHKLEAHVGTLESRLAEM